MKNAVFALAPVPLLTMPAFAATLNVGDKPVALNTRCFQSEQNNEYLLHYRRSGRVIVVAGYLGLYL